MTSEAQPFETPPIQGTYHGRYTEKEHGTYIEGTFRMVLRKHKTKIMGPFDFLGRKNKMDASFVGMVVTRGRSGSILRFAVVRAEGYQPTIMVYGAVIGSNLEGVGHSGSRKQGDYSHWVFSGFRE